MTDKYTQTSSMLPLDPKIHFISCDGVQNSQPSFRNWEVGHQCLLDSESESVSAVPCRAGVGLRDSDTVTVTARARRAAGRPSSEGPCRARPPDGRPLPVAVPISKSTPTSNYS